MIPGKDEAMRLAIVGKTRSDKSTALHRLLSHTLRHPWASVLRDSDPLRRHDCPRPTQRRPRRPVPLIVTDEVQKGTRHEGVGRQIKNDLTLITEQSAALNDVLMMSTQREINAVLPSARHNLSAWLRMLGQGYYYLQADGQATQSGRTGNMTPAIQSGEAPLPLTMEYLRAILGSHDNQPTRAPTLYTGQWGSGKIWHLHNY